MFCILERVSDVHPMINAGLLYDSHLKAKGLERASKQNETRDADALDG